MSPTHQQLTAEYGQHKANVAARQADASKAARDIGEVPAPKDPARRKKCRRNLRLFCETYLSAQFSLGWSPDHLELIKAVERTILEGGRQAIAFPRGSGKTTICESGALWAMMYAHRLFPVIIGADSKSAGDNMDALKIEIESNDLLIEDFPEVCYPIAKLEGITQRVAGQHQGGEPTRITWSADEIVLPTVRDHRGRRAATSGIVVRTAGITGRVRGMKHKTSEGENRRPDLVLIDDPQTDESARSPSQCRTRERIITQGILNLAGPGQRIAALMPTTVIVKGDMADRLLDRDIYPDWHGIRKRLLNSLPTNEALWDRYDEIRKDSLRRTRTIKDATEFYLEHRAEMDEGAEAAWEERYEEGEASAIQHAMNIKLTDEYVFAAEFQNEPLDPDEVDASELLTVEGILGKHVAGSERGVAPEWTKKITAFSDVQGSSLWWMVVAWGEGFRGAVLDYRTFPEQGSRYYQLRDLRNTLAKLHPKAGPEARVRAGLEAVTENVLTREVESTTGGSLPIDRAAIDSGWQAELVYEHARRNKSTGVIPSKGEGVTAAGIPMTERRRKPGETIGLHWILTSPQHSGTRRLNYDTNFWKTFVTARLATAIGDSGSLDIHGGKPREHELLADHVTAETFTRTSGRGREVEEWKPRLNGADNHFFDCLVGNAVLASVEGISLKGERSRGAAKKKKRKIRLSERKAQRLGARP